MYARLHLLTQLIHNQHTSRIDTDLLNSFGIPTSAFEHLSASFRIDVQSDISTGRTVVRWLITRMHMRAYAPLTHEYDADNIGIRYACDAVACLFDHLCRCVFTWFPRLYVNDMCQESGGSGLDVWPFPCDCPALSQRLAGSANMLPPAGWAETESFISITSINA